MEVLLVIGIAIVTFVTRVVNLLNIPIFTDEAIYIRWAQIGLADPAQRYIALTDGKQPLLTWFMYPMFKLFHDPLFAGRFVSVLSGVAAVVGIYFVARNLFGKKAAVASSILYIIAPFNLLYDRLALMDSLLATIGIWSLYLEILLVKKIRLDVALLLGMTVGLGLLTKSSALFYILLLPFSLVLFDFKAKKKIRRLLKWVGLSLISTFIAEVMYNSLRLSPWFYLIKQKNYSFIYTVPEFFHAPFSVFLPNLHGLLQFLIPYMTVPVDVVLIVIFIFAIIKKDNRLALLYFWFLVPFLALAAFGKVLFPRFLLFMTMSLLVIVGYTLTAFGSFSSKKMKAFLIVIPIIVIFPLYQSFLLLTNPVNAAIPVTDRNQLFNNWPSGYGVNEVITYLKDKSSYGKIVLGTEGTFGLFPAVFQIYLGNDKNIDIHGYWPVGNIPSVLLESAKKYPTYLVFKETQQVPSNWPLKLIGKYRRGNSDTFLLFYQVLVQPGIINKR